MPDSIVISQPGGDSLGGLLGDCAGSSPADGFAVNRWAAGVGTLTVTPVPGLPGVAVSGEIDEATW